ncbi:MAG: class C beta-lactamase-related serine hydrolase [Acholeplasma sp.]|jgi:CubicO group peptidase (beta-lactamase class C family)|nr:MAG: class C beta-lactamase-related serine hydrolase [Acholeplasma sp.]
MNSQKYEQLTKMANEKKFSGLIQIEENNTLVYQYIQGFENREKHIPITKNTLFAIASGTKFLTALAIGKLIDEKKFTLDSKVKDLYDLKIESIDPKITIRHLLSNTSGMADYLDEDLLDDSVPIHFDVPFKDLINPKDFIPIFSKREQKSTPGEIFNYNNQGFVYLAIIIEEISKIAYKDYINQNILKPLGIFRSGIYHLDDYPQGTALGYLNNKEDSPTNIGLLPYQSGGDGGAIFSFDELRTLWKSFFDYKIISKELVNEFIKIHAAIDEKTNNFYGLGLWLKKKDDEITPYLLGGDPGISFSSSYSPFTQKYTCAVSNTSHGVWDIFGIYKDV